jgi:transposase
MARPSRFSPEVRERAVRMVFEHTQDHASQWAPITSVAEKIGCAAETLRSGGGGPSVTAAARPA